jgi:hypothetical protein
MYEQYKFLGHFMHPQKKIYAKEIYYLVTKICQKISVSPNATVSSVFNITNKDAHEIINKILIALPDNYFYNSNTIMLYDMLAFISKNWVLFQVQEDIQDENYANHLIDFINSLSISIGMRYDQNLG